MSSVVRFAPGLVAASALFGLAACGGGGGSGKESHSIGGTVSGLSGSGLVLTDNGGDSLSVGGNGNVTFAKLVTDGNSFNVQVATQPSQPTQTCSVAHGSGTVSGSDITNVAITCTTNTYTVGGTVSGLSGSGLVLANNGGNNLTVGGNGTFTFTVLSGAAYAVTVATQPTNPPQTCSVTNASGTVASANISNVAVNCTTNAYSVVAYVSGLTGSGLTLAYNSGTPVAITGNGPTKLASAVAIGTAYTVTIAGQPTSPAQTCVSSNGSGTVGPMNVTSISIYCPRPVGRFAYVVGGGNSLAGGPTNPGIPGTLSVYSIDSGTGALTLVPGSTVSAGPNVKSFQPVPNSHFAWALNFGDDYSAIQANAASSISAYTVDPITGLLTPATGNPHFDLDGYAGAPGCGINPGGYGATFAVTLALSGTFGYASTTDQMGAPNANVWTFTVDPATGAPHLATGSTVPALCGAPGPVTIGPSGQFAYVVAQFDPTKLGGDTGLFSFSVDASTGALTQLTGSPMDTQTANAAGAIVTDPAGRFAYANLVRASLGGVLGIYDIDFASGQLTAGSPLPIASSLAGVTIEPRGQFAYLVTGGGIAIYSIDQTTGALTPATGAADITLTGATALQIDPSGQFAYTTAQVGSGTPIQSGVYAYTLNATTGALTPVAGSPFAVSANPGNPTVITVNN